jgi:hypothetical protein
MRNRNADDVVFLIEQIGAVWARQACVIADIGLTRLYELIAPGELESYLYGKSRKAILRRLAPLRAGRGERSRPRLSHPRGQELRRSHPQLRAGHAGVVRLRPSERPRARTLYSTSPFSSISPMVVSSSRQGCREA